MNKYTTSTLAASMAIASTLTTASAAIYQQSSGSNAPTNIGTGGFSTVTDTITTIGNYMLAILLGVGVIYIIMAAYKFLTSAGDPKKVGDARQALIYSMVAIAVGVLAKGLASLAGGLAQGL